MISRRQLLEHAKAQRATDIHVCAGAPIMFRIGGKNIIRRKGGFFLRSVIETGKKHGMTTMLESLNSLLEEGKISEDVAKAVSINYE